MGSSHRLAAMAAVSHAGHHYNKTATQPEVTHADNGPYNVNVLFLSVTICGVLVAVCAACWRRVPAPDKPEEVVECRGVYTVSCDAALNQIPEPLPGPPPAYESVVDSPEDPKDVLQEVIGEECPRCHSINTSIPVRRDSGLPSYETAVLLKDTKL